MSQGKIKNADLAEAINVANGGSGQTGYTIGDILYASSASTLSKLGIGTAGQILTVAGGLPSWSDLLASLVANTPAGTISATTVQGAINELDTEKEPTITAGTTLQYYRGDKTFQTLNTAAVAELTNLYFTDARAIAAPLTGFLAAAGTVTATDTILQAFNKVVANIDLLEGGLVLKGNWDASAGTFPGAGAAQQGWFYIVSVAGTVDSVSFNVGDKLYALVDNASTTTFAGNWQKIDTTDQVASVFGRVGTVVAVAGDYTASQVTNVPAGGISAVTVQAAIDELDTEKANISGTLAQFASTTSAQLASIISDGTGTGALVFGTSPTLVTPALGTPSALVLTNATGLPISTGLLAGTSADLASVITDETGTGALVFASSPTLVTPTIASLVNANHDHTNAAGGGQLTDAALSAPIGTAKGGTGLTAIGTANQVLGVNAGATGLEYKTLTAGTGIDITHAAGSTTIAVKSIVAKKADQSVNNSTVLVADTALQFPVTVGETYVFNFDLLVTNSNNAGPDWKCAVVAPAGSTGRATMSGDEPVGAVFPQATTTNLTTAGTLVNATIVADLNIPFQVSVQGVVTAGATGTVQLQWAQNTATAVNLTVLAGSILTWTN